MDPMDERKPLRDRVSRHTVRYIVAAIAACFTLVGLTTFGRVDHESGTRVDRPCDETMGRDAAVPYYAPDP